MWRPEIAAVQQQRGRQRLQRLKLRRCNSSADDSGCSGCSGDSLGSLDLLSGGGRALSLSADALRQQRFMEALLDEGRLGLEPAACPFAAAARRIGVAPAEQAVRRDMNPLLAVWLVARAPADAAAVTVLRLAIVLWALATA